MIQKEQNGIFHITGMWTENEKSPPEGRDKIPFFCGCDLK
jgi:hypothetical protein